MKTTALKPEHVPSVAALHIQGINGGFISSLGAGFVTALYEAIVNSNNSFGFAVEDNERVLGFVAFTSSITKLYKSVIAKKGFRMAGFLAGRILSFKQIRNALETLFYPARVRKKNLASTELLSIVVCADKRNQGLGTELVVKSLQQCSRLGLESVKVLVAADNQPANKLYQKCGFTFVRQIKNHGVLSNIYQVQIAEAISKYFNSTGDKHYTASKADDSLYSFNRQQISRVA